MTRPGIEPRSPRPLANILCQCPVCVYIYIYTVTKLKNMNKVFGPLSVLYILDFPGLVLLASPLLIRLPLLCIIVIIAIMLRPIFTTRPAFNSRNKDKQPIFKQSNLIYKFVCRCSSTYIGITCQHLEVRIRQHIPRSLLSGQLTSGYSQAMDLAIGKHLLTINSCRTSYEDDCFSVLHRARDKFHLKFLEVIYISMNRPSLCRQLNNHTLNILGDLLDTGGELGFLGFFF